MTQCTSFAAVFGHTYMGACLGVHVPGCMHVVRTPLVSTFLQQSPNCTSALDLMIPTSQQYCQLSFILLLTVASGSRWLCTCSACLPSPSEGPWRQRRKDRSSLSLSLSLTLSFFTALWLSYYPTLLFPQVFSKIAATGDRRDHSSTTVLKGGQHQVSWDEGCSGSGLGVGAQLVTHGQLG